MSFKEKLEKTAKKVSMFSNLAGPLIGSILPIANSNVFFNIEDGTGCTMEIRDLNIEIKDGRVEPVSLELSGKETNFLDLINGDRSFASAWVNELVSVKGVKNNLLNALVIGMILSM
ncbi:MAG: hypothetical protein GF329_13540 [Candidatus Lokiarchaeota archaeon]|nr:hypothetical protein [Candidatus Lokiarchaeota archaeon]